MTTRQGLEGARAVIADGRTYLGIEFGSTRIKAVLIDEQRRVLATGGHGWENSFRDGLWTYDLEDVREGMQEAYRDLAGQVRSNYGLTLHKVKSLGISGMMHGFLPFDKDGKQLATFRTWRNSNTGDAVKVLSPLFNCNIPQRWSIAQLYQSILDGADYVPEIDFLTTLAGYVHWQLSGERVLGIGDAVGMFPMSAENCDYDQKMIDSFEALPKVRAQGISLRRILPRVLLAGQSAGELTATGAALLDPTGQLRPGIPMCPPEGDAATGMVATNSVTRSRGTVSAGTSVFAIIVLDRPLTSLHPEIDPVMTPDGKPVAMVHCSNGTSELDAWVRIFGEFANLCDLQLDKNEIYDILYRSALTGTPDGGGLMAFNYLAGEHISEVAAGRPMYMRRPDSEFTLANFMLVQLYSVFATLRIGLDVLRGEGVHIDELLAHGGMFKTPIVAQKIMAAALQTPVTVRASAGEGGAWGIALLAQFMSQKQTGCGKDTKADQDLEQFLNTQVFSDDSALPSETPNPELQAGFEEFYQQYRKVLSLQRQAGDLF